MIIVPEWVLINTSNAFQEVKKQFLTDFDLHTIVSLPAGIFLPYSGGKTNILFFNKTKATEQIFYYEVDPARKLTKNKHITSEELSDMVAKYTTREICPHSWVISVAGLKDYDLSAKNPAKIKEIIHRTSSEIMTDILATYQKIEEATQDLQNLIS